MGQQSQEPHPEPDTSLPSSSPPGTRPDSPEVIAQPLTPLAFYHIFVPSLPPGLKSYRSFVPFLGTLNTFLAPPRGQARRGGLLVKSPGIGRDRARHTQLEASSLITEAPRWESGVGCGVRGQSIPTCSCGPPPATRRGFLQRAFSQPPALFGVDLGGGPFPQSGDDRGHVGEIAGGHSCHPVRCTVGGQRSQEELSGEGVSAGP